jgi:nicotinamidase-related amidase
MAKTALIIGDLQNGIVANFGNDLALVERARAAIDAARAAGIAVIFVRVGFRAGHPDVSAANKMFGGVAKAGLMLEDDASTQLHDRLGARPEDVLIVKRRVGAFNGTDLDLVLRSLGVTEIVLGGIATSGVILSTVRAAADLDYEITVLADLTRDADEEVHRVLIEKLFPRQCTVTTASEWTSSLGG